MAIEWDCSALGFGIGVRLLSRASTVNPKKLETGLRPNSAGIPYTLLLRIGAMGFPTFGRLLYGLRFRAWGLGFQGLGSEGHFGPAKPEP